MPSSFQASATSPAVGHPGLLAGLPCVSECAESIHGVSASPGLHIDAEGGIAAPAGLRPVINLADWDVMFDAVRSRLIHSVGERLGELPEVPHHCAELSASLVQAVVLDCVTALEQLHAALRQERSQRPTP